MDHSGDLANLYGGSMEKVHCTGTEMVSNQSDAALPGPYYDEPMVISASMSNRNLRSYAIFSREFDNTKRRKLVIHSNGSIISTFAAYNRLIVAMISQWAADTELSSILI